MQRAQLTAIIEEARKSGEWDFRALCAAFNLVSRRTGITLAFSPISGNALSTETQQVQCSAHREWFALSTWVNPNNFAPLRVFGFLFEEGEMQLTAIPTNQAAEMLQRRFSPALQAGAFKQNVFYYFPVAPTNAVKWVTQDATPNGSNVISGARQ